MEQLLVRKLTRPGEGDDFYVLFEAGKFDKPLAALTQYNLDVLKAEIKREEAE